MIKPACPRVEQQLAEFNAIHERQPGFRGSLVLRAEDGGMVALNLWESERDAMAGLEELLPAVQQLLEPLLQEPAVLLGAGCVVDKVTLILSPSIATFGYWIEQLLAESTGKQGKGLIPIEGEPLGQPSAYGQDRLFVYVHLANDAPHPGVEALERGGHPVVTLTLRDKFDLGGEFLRWEVATAIAGSMLGIDAP
jgi:hypothetical protein